MSAFYKCIIMLKLLIVFGTLSESKPNWSYEIISIDIDDKTPDIVRADIRRIRVSRGVYAISGTIDIKQDLNDDLLVSGHCFYSPKSSSIYVKGPFQIPVKNLTEFANTEYKNVLMESLRDCAENAPMFEDTFVPPFTKRLVTLDNCRISNEGMPSVLKSGYYKAVFKFMNQVTTTVTIVVQVEQD